MSSIPWGSIELLRDFATACEEIATHTVEGSRALSPAEVAVVMKLAPEVETTQAVQGIKFNNGDILISFVPKTPTKGIEGLGYLLVRVK
jgi:hypothetical protein